MSPGVIFNTVLNNGQRKDSTDSLGFLCIWRRNGFRECAMDDYCSPGHFSRGSELVMRKMGIRMDMGKTISDVRKTGQWVKEGSAYDLYFLCLEA